jgi:hypothetical protein
VNARPENPVIHTRVILTCKRYSRTLDRMVVAHVEDFGIAYLPVESEGLNHPRVLARTNDLERRYPVVEVSFRDAA